MILLDMNQVMIATLMAQLGNHKNAELDVDMLRHMVLNSLRSNNSKFRTKYGKMIICSDCKYSWRKEYFPYYKANRKTARDESELDWNVVFEAFDTIKKELDEIFPYTLIQVDKAEGDDVIGTIVHKYGSVLNDNSERILILSGDKDFVQLHVYANVDQFDPVKKKFIKHNDPSDFLKTHIIKGDSGDGIPNILSVDSSFVNKIRQKSMTEGRLLDFKNHPENMDALTKRNYDRNKTLIDLSLAPDSVKTAIIEKFEQPNTKNRSKILQYMMDKKLKLLMENIGDF